MSASRRQRVAQRFSLTWVLTPAVRQSQIRLLPILLVSWAALWASNTQPSIQAQDLSWVNSALERSKQAQRENLPAWQYDPRVAVGSGDASLNDICVVNPDRIFAVGDRGLILASIDGGRSWRAQNSGTSLNLNSVAFLDEVHGVAVGGTVQPMTQTSVGIVLITSDAGNSWRVVSSVNRASLPRLVGVKHESGGHLRAWGDYSSAHLTGIFESQDRGQSWLPVASPLSHVQCLASQKHGAVLALDRAGRLGQVPVSASRPNIQLATPTTPIRAITHSGQQWWAIGSAGTLASSRDGLQWTDQPLPLSPTARSACDLRCIHHHEQNIWIGGSPGSILLHSGDGGATWNTVATGQNWTIQAIRFLDRNRGWLVTVAGSILATRDGGATWFPQRSVVKRLGLETICASEASIPWPALAESTWQAGQSAELLVVHRLDAEDVVGFQPDAPSTLAALGVQTGLVASVMAPGWPLGTPNDIHRRAVYYGRERLSSLGAQPLLSLHDQLVLRMRMNRPTAILIDDGSSNSKSLAPLVELTMRAAEAASTDSTDTAWMTSELRLPAWKSLKFLSSALADRADFTIAQDQLLRDSGLSISDALVPVALWRGRGLTNTPLRCLQMNSGSQLARQSLLASSDRHPEAARQVDLSKVGNLQLLMGRVHRQRAWQTLTPNPLNADEPLESWLKKVDAVTESTPRTEVGQALYELADACWQAGNWHRWREVIDRLAMHAPLTDSARWGSLAILQTAASDERMAWELNQTSSSPGKPIELAQTKVKLASPPESDPFDNRAAQGNNSSTIDSSTNEKTTIQLVSAEEPLSSTSAQQIAHLRDAISQYNRVNESDRALAARPDVVLAHYARRRALSELANEPVPDANALQLLTSSQQLGGWPQVAQQEAALASGRIASPAWTAFAHRTETPPALDGQAGDACWKNSTSIDMTNPFEDGQASGDQAQVTFAYDSEFLYVLTRCASRQAFNEASTQADSPRRYDMDLDATDHVVLNLDTDRDYTSACELAVNQWGHTFDRCCGRSQWNPQWYVAVDRTPKSWTAEVAIRLSDLTCREVTAGRVWAISAFRYLPDGQVLSWSQLRSYNPRLQGNGLLVFQ